MRNVIRTGALVSTLALLLNALPAAQQGRKAAQASVPRTPWGHPDLQGTWNNSTITPLERPAKFAGREFLTEAWSGPEGPQRAPFLTSAPGAWLAANTKVGRCSLSLMRDATMPTTPS